MKRGELQIYGDLYLHVQSNEFEMVKISPALKKFDIHPKL